MSKGSNRSDASDTKTGNFLVCLEHVASKGKALRTLAHDESASDASCSIRWCESAHTWEESTKFQHLQIPYEMFLVQPINKYRNNTVLRTSGSLTPKPEKLELTHAPLKARFSGFLSILVDDIGKYSSLKVVHVHVTGAWEGIYYVDRGSIAGLGSGVGEAWKH